MRVLLDQNLAEVLGAIYSLRKGEGIHLTADLTVSEGKKGMIAYLEVEDDDTKEGPTHREEVEEMGLQMKVLALEDRLSGKKILAEVAELLAKTEKRRKDAPRLEPEISG